MSKHVDEMIEKNMETKENIENKSPVKKEFQSLLEKDFKDRKLKENSIIKATVTEITKNFVSCRL